MTDQEHILRGMSVSELEIYLQIGGSLPGDLMRKVMANRSTNPQESKPIRVNSCEFVDQKEVA